MIEMDFTDRTAIVIGGSKGIGKAIAELLLRLNCSVTITSTGDTPKWCKVYQNCNHITLDVLDDTSMEKFLSKVKKMKVADILVYNAGIHIPQPVFAIEKADWDMVLKVNLYGPMCILRALTPKMKNVKRGKIVNISSIAGLVSKPGSGAYSASKSGLIGLTRASALDLAPYNILVNALCPGPTQTDMLGKVLSEEQKESLKKNIPLRRFATAEEIANFAVLLCSDLNTYITGQTIVVDGGITAQ